MLKNKTKKLYAEESYCVGCEHQGLCYARPHSIECYNQRSLNLLDKKIVVNKNNINDSEQIKDIESVVRLKLEIEDLEEKIKKLKSYYEEQEKLNNMITFSKNETIKTIRISKEELNYIKIQLDIMNSLLTILKLRQMI